MTDDWPPGVPSVVSTSPVDGGYICSTQRATLADGRDVVVKRCPYPADQEAEGLESLRAAGVPTPGIVGVGARGLVLGNVSGRTAIADQVPFAEQWENSELLLTNAPAPEPSQPRLSLLPWEARVYRRVGP